MKNILLSLGLVGVLVTALVVAREMPSQAAHVSAPADGATPAAPAPAAGEPVKALTGGATTLDDLLQQFLRALKDNDRAALHALRVTEDEYKQIVIPGNVEPGAKPQVLPPDVADYYWGVLNEKSLIYELYLFEQFGGRSYALVEARNSDLHQWAGFRTYRRLRLTLRDDAGKEKELATGSVVELDGHLKFISYIRD